MASPWERISPKFREWLERVGATAEEFNSENLQGRAALKRQFDDQEWAKSERQRQPPENHDARFRRLVEDAAIKVNDAVMKNVIFHLDKEQKHDL